MKKIIDIFFWVLYGMWITLLSIFEIFIFIALFVEEKNIELFMDAFFWIMFFTVVIINFIIYWFLWFLSNKYWIDTRY